MTTSERIKQFEEENIPFTLYANEDGRYTHMQNMDKAVTGITATMSWCEDNVMVIEPQSETETMTMGGM